MCAGYGQRGGVILIEGNAGPRAGLNQKGGCIALLGNVGLLAGERRSGGTFASFGDRLGRHSHHAARGGTSVLLDRDELSGDGIDPQVFEILSTSIALGRSSGLPSKQDETTP